MKLKKPVKIVLVIVLLGIISGSFYTFNRWFFTKYNNVGEKVDQETGKENSKDISTDKNETSIEIDKENEKINMEEHQENIIDNKKEESKQSVITPKKTIKATEEYYCNRDDILEGQECIHILEMGTMVVVMAPLVDPFTQQVIREEVKGAPYCSEEGYMLQNDKCIKEVRTGAMVRYVCPIGYFLDGINCKEK